MDHRPHIVRDSFITNGNLEDSLYRDYLVALQFGRSPPMGVREAMLRSSIEMG